ncbi:MAG TPA: hypothetical protein VF143_05690 [Candidatus Nanopelagicales bacterium]
MPTRSLADQVHAGFPGAVPAAAFVGDWHRACTEQGFARGNCLLVAAVCRDELCLPFVEGLEAAWGAAFHAGSLGGLLTLGRTGMAAAGDHAPDDPEQPRRIVAFGAAHVGMGEGGAFGLLRREHQFHSSRTCGALMGFREELLAGRLRLGYDPADPEMSLLRQRIFTALSYGDLPDEVGMTKVVARVIDEDLRELLDGFIADLGDRPVVASVRTGVLIHTSAGDWFWQHDPRVRLHGGAGFPDAE